MTTVLDRTNPHLAGWRGPVRIAAAMGRGPRRPALGSLLVAGLVLGLMLAAAANDGVSAALPTSGAPFSFNFAGNPSSPQPWNPSNWDVVVNSRDVRTFAQLEGMQAQHGADCGPPPATHFNNTYQGAVFICRNHVMTAINAGGYGEIVLTPDHMVDFSGGETTIRFNLTTLRTSFRDWVDIWLTPFEDNLVLPIDPGLGAVDLQGPPLRGIQVRMDQGAGGTIFRANVIDNFKATALPFRATKSVEKLVGTPSSAIRTMFELTISRTHLKFGAPTLGYYWVDAPLAGLSFTRAVVQLAHHSYNPTKHCTPSPTLACLPNTWHWSNFYISNAVPFTLIRGDQQVMHDAVASLGVGATPKVVNFPAPAPPSAFLRFAAIGKIEISLDGGKSWEAARRQKQAFSYVEHFSSYLTPIPAGTASVLIRGYKWGWGSNPGNPWWVRDIAIWSASAPTTSGGSTTTQPASAPSPAIKPLTGTLAASRIPVTTAAGIVVMLVGLLGLVAYVVFVRRRRIRPDRK